VPAHPFYTNFTSGTVTEKLDARVDFGKYQNAARVIKNGVVLPQGGVSSRAGTIYVGPAKFAESRIRLVPFLYSTTVSYMCEFGEGYIRFWKDRAQVVDGSSVPVEVATDYTVAELRELRFEQSADVLYIGHPDHPPSKLIRTSETSFELQEISFFPPPTYQPDQSNAFTLTLSTAAVGEATATASGTSFLPGDVGRQIREFSSGAGRAVITAYVSGTSVTVRILDAFSTTGPIAAGDWVMDGTANNATCDPSAASPRFKEITLVASVDAFRPTDVDRYVYLNDGIVQITSFTDAQNVKGQILVTLTNADAAIAGSWTMESPAWSAALGYPGVPCLHQQRLWWTGSPSFPDFLWGSVTADYENQGRGALDDQAVSYQLATSGVNLVRWMKPSSSMGLALGTLGGELTVDGGTDTPITPSSVKARERTSYGSDYAVDAIKVDNQHVFIQRGRTRVREFAYSITDDAFNAPDISILAEHLFRSPVVELAYCKTPESLLFALRDDGLLNICTYERQQEVLAWAYAQLTEDTFIASDDDTFESIAAMPNFCGTGDEVWVATKRTVIGGDYWATDYWATDYWADNYWVEAAEFEARYLEVFDGQMNLDAALTYSGVAADVFTGLNHLEGRMVRVVVANGDQYTLEVVGGSVTLPNGATTTSVEIGLPWAMTLVTVRPELSLPTGTAQGRRKRWNELTVRVYGTKGNVLLNSEALDYPEGTDTTDFFSGDMKRKTDFGWDRDGLVTVQRGDAKPCTITGITGGITVADD
jgi:hypothetical protein